MIFHVTDSSDFIEQTIKLIELCFVLFGTIYTSQPVKYFDLVQVVRGFMPFVFDSLLTWNNGGSYPKLNDCKLKQTTSTQLKSIVTSIMVVSRMIINSLTQPAGQPAAALQVKIALANYF